MKLRALQGLRITGLSFPPKSALVLVHFNVCTLFVICVTFILELFCLKCHQNQFWKEFPFPDLPVLIWLMLCGKQNTSPPHAKFTIPTTKGKCYKWRYSYLGCEKCSSNSQPCPACGRRVMSCIIKQATKQLVGPTLYDSKSRCGMSLPSPLKLFLFPFPTCSLLCKMQSHVRNSNLLWAWQGHYGNQAAYLHIFITINMLGFFSICAVMFSIHILSGKSF